MQNFRNEKASTEVTNMKMVAEPSVTEEIER